METIFGTPLICDPSDAENEMQVVHPTPAKQHDNIAICATESCDDTTMMIDDVMVENEGEDKDYGAAVPITKPNPLAHLLSGYDTDTDQESSAYTVDEEDEPKCDSSRKDSNIICSDGPPSNDDDHKNRINDTDEESRSSSSPGAHANKEKEDTTLQNEEQSTRVSKDSNTILCRSVSTPSKDYEKNNNAQLYIRLFEHAIQCNSTTNNNGAVSKKCTSTNCARMKSYLNHWNTCTIKVTAGTIACTTCQRVEKLLRMCNTRIDSMFRLCGSNNNTQPISGAVNSGISAILAMAAAQGDGEKTKLEAVSSENQTASASLFGASTTDNSSPCHPVAATTTASLAYDNASEAADSDEDSDEEIGQWVYQMAKSKNKDMALPPLLRAKHYHAASSSNTLSGTKRSLEEEELCSSHYNVPSQEAITPANLDTLVECYIARDNETPRMIAKKFKLNCTDLVKANKNLYPTLRPSSKLMKGTSIQISHL